MFSSLLLMLTMLANSPAFTIADAGHASATIVVADNASPAVRFAATELADNLKLVSGAEFAIKPVSEAGQVTPAILVGDSPRVQAVWPAAKLNTLGPDGIVLQTVGQNLILAGQGQRGALYAVDEFLEKVVGCRWWTSTESTIPHRDKLVVEPLSVRYSPTLAYREVFYRDAFNGLFGARLRSNGQHSLATEEQGSHYTLIGWCHTSYKWLPPEQYFNAHPDWYGLHNGKRDTSGQLCFSNPEMCAEMAKVAVEQVKANPTAGIIDVSQNDCGGWCECPACRKIVAEEGSEAGPLLRCINTVAAAVQKECPGTLVETLAYNATRKPPKVTRPADNVLIRLCSIECDFGHPLETSPSNKAFANDIRGWAKMAPHLFIWNYVTNFTNYLIPHQNFKTLAPDIRFFLKNHTMGIFEQGDFITTTSDFQRLRVWLIGHLLWNPQASQAKLTTEFLNGYYGAAGPYLQKVLDVRQKSFDKVNPQLHCYQASASNWLSLNAMVEMSKLYDAAEKAVAFQPELLARVTRERLSLTLAMLQHDRIYRARAQRLGLPWPSPDEAKRMAAAWRQRVLDEGTTQFSEGGAIQPYADNLVKDVGKLPSAITMAGPTPDACRDLPKDKWISFAPQDWRFAEEGTWVFSENDPVAGGALCARMPATHTQWAVQRDLGPLVGGRWHLYIVARIDPVDKANPVGGAIGMGLYDEFNQRSVQEVHPNIGQVGDGAYHVFDLGTHLIDDAMYAWVAPYPGQAKNVWVSQIYAVKE